MLGITILLSPLCVLLVLAAGVAIVGGPRDISREGTDE